MTTDAPTNDPKREQSLALFRRDLHAHIGDANHAELGDTIDALTDALKGRAGHYAPLIEAAVSGIRQALNRAAGAPSRDRNASA